MPEYAIERDVPKVLPVLLGAILAGLAAAPDTRAGHRGRNCAATITASFADSCRGFATHSNKDISHVEVHYASGDVVKDERIRSHDYAIDGGAGEEIQFAIVKSGRTSERFDCEQGNSAPPARLEIKTPPIDQTLEHCYDFFSGGLACEQSSPRSVWTSASDVRDDGGDQSGWLTWGCGGLGEASLCSYTVSFRGTASSDPDGDITSWSLDFGDGSSASGSWTAAPPVEVAHVYAPNSVGTVHVITLTVTDSAGQSDSQVLSMVFVDQTPD